MLAAARTAATRCPLWSEQFHRRRYSFQVPEDDDDVGVEEHGESYFERQEEEISQTHHRLDNVQSQHLALVATVQFLITVVMPDRVFYDAQDVNELARSQDEQEAKYRKQQDELDEKQEKKRHVLGDVVQRYRRTLNKLAMMPNLIEKAYELEPQLQAALLQKEKDDIREQKVIEDEKAIQDEVRTLQSLNDEIFQLELENAEMQWQIEELAAMLSTESTQTDKAKSPLAPAMQLDRNEQFPSE